MAEDFNKSNQTDSGLGEKYLGKTKRIINKDGSFNVYRNIKGSFIHHTYHELIQMTWWKFFSLVIITYILLNTFFATIYYIIGVEYITGIEGTGLFYEFMCCFYFSVQTFTTVGYGVLAPTGLATSLVASFEALVGLLGFALATGLLYGRFSKPSAKVKFSKKAIISPYKEINSIQFRVVNERKNILTELEARVMVMTHVVGDNGELNRKYENLPLEVSKINFFPMNWTIVHAIDEKSPLYKMTLDEMKQTSLEVLILIKGFDESYGQWVHIRHSYCSNEIEFGAVFERIFHTDEEGDIIVEVDKISNINESKLN